LLLYQEYCHSHSRSSLLDSTGGSSVSFTLKNNINIQFSESNPCGGGVEYLHRDPANRKRRRNVKSQIWDSKIWLRVPRDSDPRKTALGRPSNIYKRQLRPLVRKGAPQKQDRNCQTVIAKYLVMSLRWGSTPRLTGWLTVSRNVTLNINVILQSMWVLFSRVFQQKFIYLCICNTVYEGNLNKLRKKTELYKTICPPVCFIPRRDLNWFVFQSHWHRAAQSEADSRFRLDRLPHSGRSKWSHVSSRPKWYQQHQTSVYIANFILLWTLSKILWWTKWRWGRFSPSISVSPANFHSINCSKNHRHLSSGFVQ
jgi:hypothetical protein